MNLTELLQKLSYGPLAELAVAGEGSGVVPPANIPRLVIPLNNALTKLYARFKLQTRTMILETVDGVYAYRLAPQFAQLSGSTELNKYIKDTVDNPFLDDVIQVTSIMGNQASLPTDPHYITQPRSDTNDYVDLPMNNVNDRLSWHTLSYDTLGMDYPKTGDRYFIQYRAKHAPIPLQPADASLVEIHIPDQLELALLSSIAGAIYAGISSDTAVGKANMHAKAYEAECQRCELQDMFNQFSESTNLKPVLGGWF
jgi:hypothetical protein